MPLRLPTRCVRGRNQDETTPSLEPCRPAHLSRRSGNCLQLRSSKVGYWPVAPPECSGSGLGVVQDLSAASERGEGAFQLSPPHANGCLASFAGRSSGRRSSAARRRRGAAWRRSRRPAERRSRELGGCERLVGAAHLNARGRPPLRPTAGSGAPARARSARFRGSGGGARRHGRARRRGWGRARWATIEYSTRCARPPPSRSHAVTPEPLPRRPAQRRLLPRGSCARPATSPSRPGRRR